MKQSIYGPTAASALRPPKSITDGFDPTPKMNEPYPRWFLALNLGERLAYCRENGFPAERSSSVDAVRRLSRWKQSRGFNDLARFKLFLEREELTELELQYVLGCVPCATERPVWLEAFLTAEAAHRPSVARDLDDSPRQFLMAVAPLIEKYRKDLLDRTPSGGPFDPRRAVDMLTPLMAPRLLLILQRTLILETNIARLEGKLEGDTATGRFHSFLKGLEDPARRGELFALYPVMGRVCIEYLEQWRDASAEFLTRLTRDHQEIQLVYGETGELERISGGVGDAHRSGRSVLIAQFERGLRLVYKPRPMAVDSAFQDLIRFLNDSGHAPSLRELSILARDGYGWSEFVEFKECAGVADVELFYRRQGSWIALLYALGATDLHLENLIASGEHPVVIDLEALFHPVLFSHAREWADDQAREKMSESVMSLGLLPLPALINGRAFDTSGLGATSHQVLPYEVDGLEAGGTDEIRVAKVTSKLGEIRSRPRCAGADVDIANHRGSIEEGFAQTYRFLLERRTRLLAEIERFKNVPTRVVLRPSATYASLLYDSYHPKLLRDAIGRDLFFFQLWEETTPRPGLARAVPSEYRQCLAGDIPYFSSVPSSLEIVGGDGTRVTGAFVETGWDHALRRINGMGEADLKEQRWFIQASLESLPLSTDGRGETRKHSFYGPTTSSGFLGAAEKIGNHLVDSAIRRGGSASWISLHYKGDPDETSRPKGRYLIGILDAELYGGLSGIILFLAYLYSLSPKSSYREVAEEALATLEERLRRSTTPRPPGAFSGTGGFLYLYLHLAALWDRAELLDRARSFLPELEGSIGRDHCLDLISGSAGCIPILLSLNGSRATALAERCGDRILEVGLGALGLPRGFSHGSSGVAWALSHLDGERFRTEALAAIARERELLTGGVGSSRVDLQACKLEYSIVSPK